MMSLDLDTLTTTYLTSPQALLIRRPICAAVLHGLEYLAEYPHRIRRRVVRDLVTEERFDWAVEELQKRDLVDDDLFVTPAGSAALSALNALNLPRPPEEVFERLADEETVLELATRSFREEPAKRTSDRLEELGRQAQAAPRDDRLWTAIVETEGAHLRRIILALAPWSSDADDVEQVVWARAFKLIQEWNPSAKPFRTWLRHLVYHEASAQFHRAMPERGKAQRQEMIDTMIYPFRNPSEREQVEMRDELSKLLRQLPAHQRQALVLRHLVGLRTSEVAFELGVSSRTVQRWLNDASDTLRGHIGDRRNARAAESS